MTNSNKGELGRGGFGVWTVVFIAPNKKEAQRLEEILTSEGLLVKIRSSGLSQTGDSSLIEILVPESEAREALEVINNT
ncbi:MAG: Uncharacterized protein XD97_0580 [Pelotomaculum thermopropionicum]|uniref:DUF2007 domain-containing protein n=1 Tax=Pelotomaculum thermopropionicum TaxID=110500 RepID=A0A101HRJ1_9FIRM|nr:MAG: Uncharacterized protein XD97_0580 [Pelotomaculum thermopropionicum]